MNIAGLDGDPVRIDDSQFRSFESRVDGRVLQFGESGFEEAVSIWNGMIDRQPALVVQPAHTGDVVRTVGMVRDLGLELSIKGGGHNIAGLSLSDGGVTLDMSEMARVDVDEEKMSVSVGPGCRLGDVDVATQAHGLATTLGFVSLTGVAGLTLGGGFGYLTRQFGWTADDLLEAEIVLANGDVLRASRAENDDLFWALRGGGGNFGVVTEYVFRVHEIGPEITGGLVAWSADQAEEAMSLYRDMTESVPRELTMALMMRNAPPAPWLPEEKHGLPVVLFVINHTGSEEQAETDLEPIRALRSPWANLVQRKSYTDQQSMLDATMPNGMHYYWKSEFFGGLSDEMLATYRAQFDDLKAPANVIAMMHIEGALNEHSEDDGAVGNRDAKYVMPIQSMYPGESGSADANKAWVRNAWQALQPFATGGNYINFQTDDEGSDRLSSSYRGNLVKLAQIKRQFDPDNLFRVNRNIEPA